MHNSSLLKQLQLSFCLKMAACWEDGQLCSISSRGQTGVGKCCCPLNVFWEAEHGESAGCQPPSESWDLFLDAPSLGHCLLQYACPDLWGGVLSDGGYKIQHKLKTLHGSWRKFAHSSPESHIGGSSAGWQEGTWCKGRCLPLASEGCRGNKTALE